MPIFASVVGRLEHEVSGEVLEQYRRAGAEVYERMRQLGEQRSWDDTAPGISPSHEAGQAETLCVWNALVLQTLGDKLVEADYKQFGWAKGYLPPETFRQALAFYDHVEGWRRRAATGVVADLHLPADLSEWAGPGVARSAFVLGLERAASSNQRYLEPWVPAVVRAGQVARSRLAVLTDLLRDSGELADPGQHGQWEFMTPEQAQPVEENLRRALQMQYHLGQLLAMPQLIDEYRAGQVTEAMRLEPDAGDLRLPHEAGFDPWQLTDPQAREELEQDPEVRTSILEMWTDDPDPHRTQFIALEIEGALAGGLIANAIDTTGERLGHYSECPWAPIHVARTSLYVGGRQLTANQQFTVHISADQAERGGTFVREIVLGPFTPATRLGYWSH